MQIEIYADVFFAINFIMDLFIFWIAGKLLRRNFYFGRMLLGVFIMTILHCLLFFIFNNYYNIWSAILILITGIIIVFRPQNFLSLIKLILFVHIIAFAIGGMTMALFYYIDFSSIIGNTLGFKFENFSFKILLASTCIAFVFIKLFVSRIKKNLISKQVFYDVSIFLSDNQITFNALVDTGNSLYDKSNDLPIIIAEFDAIKNIFTKQIRLAIYEKDFEKLCMSNIKFSFVPFKSVSNESAILICFKPDYIKISSDQNKFIRNAIVGICNFTLSNSYHGLINPDLIN